MTHCRCGNTLKNVPEHLQGLAEFICGKCSERQPIPTPIYRHAAVIEPKRESLPTRDPKRERRK